MSKKKSVFLKEENLLTLLSQNNFIIPEIQREYVWGENEKVIVDFLKDIKSQIGDCCTSCSMPLNQNKINIGFLYSYKPEYVKIKSERLLDERLIDGQQRFTTIFLLLFVHALNENRKIEFLTLIRFEDKIKMSFDFRVRDLTKRFLLELIDKIETIEQLRDIDKQTWYLKDYQNDISIKAMQKALGYILMHFLDTNKYYYYLINYIVFWHFKTEVTSQGEELYITMNARGEELAFNEVTKAALMVGNSQLFEWGKKWEEWQQFFWKNKNQTDINPNADKGFNGFLSCIAGLEFYIETSIGESKEKDVQKLLTLEKVEKYFLAFKTLIDKKKDFARNYNYSMWIEKCLSDIWLIFNANDTDWLVDYRDKNRSTERNKMVFTWSWLYYCTSRNNNVDLNELYRTLRFFYIRYNNFNRSVSTLKKTIDMIIKHGIWSSFENEVTSAEENSEDETDTKYRTLEEINKNKYLQSQHNKTNFTEIESAIWEIEDHPLNLDGSDVGNINISHLLTFNENITLENLHSVKDTFNALFPDKNKKESSLLVTILLHYGDFMLDTSYYYKRYDFSNWKHNIRKKEFNKLIADLKDKDQSILLKELHNRFLLANKDVIQNSVICLPDMDLKTKLIYYSLLISPDELWQAGEKIIIRNDIPFDGTHLFENEKETIFNSKGNFRGNIGNTDLLSLLKQKHNAPLLELKNKLITILSNNMD